MAVAKQVYTATGTWTASQLANVFRDAFIDAGLMTAWHDSFLSGSIENRVLEVQYDAAKAYGKTYYWFQFATNGVYLQMATGWNTGSDVPTGTQWLDYLSTDGSSTSAHVSLRSGITSAVTLTLTRYTSSVAPGDSWFVIQTGAVHRAFTIAPDSVTMPSWMDLDKGMFQGFTYATGEFGSQAAFIFFRPGPGIRREIVRGCGLRGNTNLSHYSILFTSLINLAYGAVGHRNAQQQNYDYGFPAILLPVGFAVTNPAYSTDSSPVFHSIVVNPYTVEKMSAEFGLSFHYATNTFSPGDTFVVTAGVEEWEILAFAAATSSVTDPSPVLLARTI